MANILENRVKEASTTVGTGTLTLTGALLGFRTFASKCAVGDTFRYGLQGVDANGAPSGDWEVGIGTYSAANQIARTTVLDSSNAGAAVVLAAGAKQVWIGMDALQASWAKEVLTADRTYYVSTAGSNAASGLSVGAPWLTIQNAVNFISRNLDLNGFNAIIQLADGAYTEAVVLKPAAGYGTIIIQGNSAAAANVTVDSAGTTFSADGPANRQYFLKRMRLTASSVCVLANNGALITTLTTHYGAVGNGYHIQSLNGGEVRQTGNYTISGAAYNHIHVSRGGRVYVGATTITLTGTPDFGGAFISVLHGSLALMAGLDFSGFATGKRYEIDYGSVCYLASSSTVYFPGSVPGTAFNGSVYA
ncbi:MAG: hypothetical protein JWQ88_3201 [Rhodoferax sp.]|nr:hypothetical protein [Rhodoferax sp.]